MTAIDIPASGARSPEILFTWQKDGFVHRVVRSNATNEWRAEKRKLTATAFTPYFWTKKSTLLQQFRDEAGI